MKTLTPSSLTTSLGNDLYPLGTRAQLRVGIIGFGKMGRVHLSILQKLPRFQVVAISDLSEKSNVGLAPDLRFHQNWKDLIEANDIDAVVITLPHFLHAECATLALQHGKHVFLEKPLATNFGDAQNLIACAEKCDRTLMVNMTHRFYPPLKRARQMLREGVLGEVISVRDHYMEIIDRTEFPSGFLNR